MVKKVLKFDQPGLFDETEAIGPVNAEVLQALIENPYSHTEKVDPRNNLPFDRDVREIFMDETFYSDRKLGREYSVPGLGEFIVLARWGTNVDLDGNGIVIKDKNTLNEYMIEWTYSSWDSPDDYQVVLAESYTHTETRWRKK